MKKIAFVILFAIMFITPAYAAEIDDFGTDEVMSALDSDTKSLLNDAYNGFSFEKIGEPDNLLQTIDDTVGERASKPFGAFLMLMGIIMVSAIFGNMNIRNDMTPTVNFVISLMFAASLMLPVSEFLKRVGDVIESSRIFISAYAPVYAAVTVSSGAPSTAASYCTLTVAASEISALVITDFLLPLIGIFSGLALVAGMSDIFKLEMLTAGAEKLIKTVIGAVSTVFIGILTVKTIIASCGDSVAFRSAKYVVSGFVPVAGGILGESLASVFSCMKYIKGTVGAFGIIAGGFIFLPVMAECMLWQMCAGAAGYFAEVFEIKSAVSILKSVSSILGMVMYLLLFMIMLLIVTTAAVLIGGGA